MTKYVPYIIFLFKQQSYLTKNDSSVIITRIHKMINLENSLMLIAQIYYLTLNARELTRSMCPMCFRLVILLYIFKTIL